MGLTRPNTSYKEDLSLDTSVNNPCWPNLSIRSVIGTIDRGFRRLTLYADIIDDLELGLNEELPMNVISSHNKKLGN